MPRKIRLWLQQSLYLLKLKSPFFNFFYSWYLFTQNILMGTTNNNPNVILFLELIIFWEYFFQKCKFRIRTCKDFWNFNVFFLFFTFWTLYYFYFRGCQSWRHVHDCQVHFTALILLHFTRGLCALGSLDALCQISRTTLVWKQ